MLNLIPLTSPPPRGWETPIHTGIIDMISIG
jgi:hypothetical protein